MYGSNSDNGTVALIEPSRIIALLFSFERMMTRFFVVECEVSGIEHGDPFFKVIRYRAFHVVSVTFVPYRFRASLIVLGLA